MQSDAKSYVERANPHSWFLIADDLHDQAVALYRRKSMGMMTVTDSHNRVVSSLPRINRSVFLLAGFALENAIKAFLVYENPHWISNGRLSRHLQSHSLTKLHATSLYVPYKNRYLWVLRSFESGLESWARYPCGLSFADQSAEKELNHQLWDGYNKVMTAYAKRLIKLLEREWKGPHGFRGKYVFTGRFFST